MTTNIPRKMDEIKQSTFFQFGRKVDLAGKRTLTYFLDKALVETLIRKWEREHGLHVSGFRKTKAPVDVIYRSNKSYLNSKFVSLLREDTSTDISARMKRAVTPLEYEVLGWDGRGQLRIEVTAYLNPAVPVPGKKFGGAASPGGASEELEPAIGQQYGFTDSDENAIRAMSSRGISVGSDLLDQRQAGVGLHWQDRIIGEEPVEAVHDRQSPTEMPLPDESLFSTGSNSRVKPSVPDVAEPEAAPVLPEKSTETEQAGTGSAQSTSHTKTARKASAEEKAK